MYKQKISKKIKDINFYNVLKIIIGLITILITLILAKAIYVYTSYIYYIAPMGQNIIKGSETSSKIEHEFITSILPKFTSIYVNFSQMIFYSCVSVAVLILIYLKIDRDKGYH